MIRFTYTIDGYVINGSVSGTLASHYTETSCISTAIIQGNPIPITLGEADPYGINPMGWEYMSSYTYYFPNLTKVPNAARMKFIYHHGYNTTTEWWASSQQCSYGPFAFLINHLGPIDHNEGGNDYQTVPTVAFNFIPSNSFLPGSVLVTSKTQNQWWPDCGNSYLESVELWGVTPTVLANQTVNYSTFIPWDKFSNNKIMIQIPGIGLAKYGNSFVPDTIIAPLPNMVFMPKQFNDVVYLTQDEYKNLFNENFQAAVQSFSDAESNKAPTQALGLVVTENNLISSNDQFPSVVSDEGGTAFLNFIVGH